MADNLSDSTALPPLPETEARVTVAVVTYHTGPVLFSMLDSVLGQPGLSELVLVDNGNPDAVVAQLQERALRETKLNFITGGGNVGFATGTNRAARAGTGEYILVLNPDSVLPPGFLQAVVAESRKHAHPHLVTCRVLDGAGKEQSGSRRALLTPWNALSEVFQLHRLFPTDPRFAALKWHEEPVPAAPVSVPCASGAVMLWPRKDFEALGGFDEGYFLHVEDIDLCLRLTRAGGEIWWMPAPFVTHLGATSEVPKAFVERLKTKSFVRYFFKNFSGEFPKPFLLLVAAAAWARFGLHVVKNWISRSK